MKKFLVLFFFVTMNMLLAQESKSASPVSPTKDSEAKLPAKTESKTPETKTEVKSTPKTETPVKKELPPLQKDGGLLVLNGVKWQADNVTKKSYIIGKEACEKEGMRLPTKDELIDAYFSKYPEFRTPGGYYLSANRRASDRSHVWYVNFDNGHHNHGPLTKEYNVRCVKAEPKPSPAKTENSAPADAKK